MADASRRLAAYLRMTGIEAPKRRPPDLDETSPEDLLLAAIDRGRRQVRELVAGLGPVLPPVRPGAMPAQPIQRAPLFRPEWWRRVLMVPATSLGGALRLFRAKLVR